MCSIQATPTESVKATCVASLLEGASLATPTTVPETTLLSNGRIVVVSSETFAFTEAVRGPSVASVDGGSVCSSGAGAPVALVSVV